MDLGSTAAVRTERVSFSATGLRLVGDLRILDPSGPSPALVLTGPFTGVKEQVVATYADRLAEAGFVTLAFDHRGFGESEGRRGHEDSQGKLDDLRAAVGLLAGRPEVDADRIGVVGICLGGGHAVRAAATDPRLRAVVGVAGAYNSPSWFAATMGVAAYRSALRGFLDRYDEYLPAVAPDGGEAAMGGPEPYAYYGTDRSASPHWENRVTRGSLHSLLTLDALAAAPLLEDTPQLLIHGRVDDYCSPELAAAFHDRSAGTKEIAWLDSARHIDLYDTEPYVTQAADAAAAFLHRHL
ncbi:alpha/beta hydrolase [Frankia sp. CNm7]|uniref:Alpha/beta hydrolase n=1 Tax=Frankia nepalensis TaxID=1836974 RepID=A0A937UQ25_9ACTN|nr:alpha/beta hydrolase [Frankia nepalensis]MBL7499413.1 alpha/beta hydrolase [Frankia nepalensis]MBL7509954.1 alpha/beta hydrolase [Frankia nepalensis]MBL7517919.1 alpha/beta hydrolase [Frankia nepalensis]MBL7629762.1 alpha/beta hydrolase [Frankia nepalensis]